MLKKTKNHDTDTVVEPEPLPPAAPGAVPNAGKTVIGKQISVDGGIQGGEDLVIEGRVKGSIDLDKFHLTIGARGVVESEIRAGNVTVSGKLKGNIHAQDKVKITKEADFSGEIHAKRISVEDGAVLKAVIDVARDAPGKVASMVKPAPAAEAPGGKDPVAMAGGAEKGK